ncbi:MAG: hypothetical protein KTV77_02220 [Wolbachia endosymbiont of Fragariocoptes setiger]|nr:hypothetical protein [Wolbachia endosymbiont of Fragariocoptes setiger]
MWNQSSCLGLKYGGQQEIIDYIDTVIVSAIQHNEKFSVDQISVNIRHNLSDYTAIKEVEATC